ncbi:MAG: Do family serine endopeptidase [Nitrospiraceae bacterium]|nr:Do family serine endopeptidase [Nitrospiraceae bacterium]
MGNRMQHMGTWSIGGGLLLALCAFAGLEGGTSASAAGVPPAFAQGFSDIVKKTTPAVVNIAVTGGGEGGRRRGGLPPGPFSKPPGEEPGGEDAPTPPPMPHGPPSPHGRPEQSAGSGVVFDSNGFIVTNNHVVEGATQITVTLNDRREFSAKIIGADPKTDLAVIKIEAKNLPSLKWAEYEKLQVGDLVLAVGSPFGLSSTVTLGIISALGRGNVGIADYEDFIQTDAAINPGNSGGALVNLKGELIGINTAIINFAQGIGFAIPSNMAKQVIEQLLAKGKVVRGWLGVGIQPLTAELAKKFGVTEGGGVLVNEVFEKDPAALAGIQPGDVIVRINGVVVDSPNKLSRLIGTLTPGATPQIEVVRDLKHLILDVPLTERPETPVLASIPRMEKLESKLGLEVQEPTASLVEKFKLRQTKGAVITKVEPNSLAQAEGLREGDLIIEVNRAEISSLMEFTSTISQSHGGMPSCFACCENTAHFTSYSNQSTDVLSE